MLFTWLTQPEPYRATTCRERELTLDHIYTFLTTQEHGRPHRMRDQINTEATSHKTRILKTIHTSHAHIHSDKANMKGWLWQPNDIRRLCEPKVSWNCLIGEGKKTKKPSPRKLVPTWDRTQAHCVTCADAIACSTVVDLIIYSLIK